VNEVRAMRGLGPVAGAGVGIQGSEIRDQRSKTRGQDLRARE
jgi:hypothetical protein